MLPLFNRTWAALTQHNKIYTRPSILDLAWCATKYQIWSLLMMTQWRANNTGPQTQNTNSKLTKYKLAQPPLIPMGIYKKSTAQSPIHDGCNVEQGSFIHCYKSYSQMKNRAVNMTCHLPLLLPDPDLSFTCWGGNPYYLVLFSGFNKITGFVDNDSVKHPFAKPHTVVPWWSFCTGKQKAYAYCTATSH